MELNPIEELMSSTLDRISKIIDINSVIGKPIIQGNTLIIPISKVGFGFLTGGGEYSETQPKVKYDTLPHAGGSGGGVSIKPLGFLIIENGVSRYINIEEEGKCDKWTDLINAGINVLKSKD